MWNKYQKVWGITSRKGSCLMPAFLGVAFGAVALTNISLIPNSVISWDAACDELVTWRLCSINKALILL